MPSLVGLACSFSLSANLRYDRDSSIKILCIVGVTVRFHGRACRLRQCFALIGPDAGK